MPLQTPAGRRHRRALAGLIQLMVFDSKHGEERARIVGIATGRRAAITRVYVTQVKMRGGGRHLKHLNAPNAGARQTIANEEHLSYLRIQGFEIRLNTSWELSLT